MKKFYKLCAVSVLTVTLMLLTACDAEKVNSAVNAVGDAAGLEIDSNIKQEQIDKVQEKVKEGAEKVKDIVTDEDVQDAVKGLGSAIKDAAAGD